MIIIALTLVGCNKDKAPAFTEFTFAGQSGQTTIDKKGHTVTAVAASTVTLASITPSFTLSPDGTTATVNGVLQVSGATVQNFNHSVNYSLKTTEGDKAEWTVTIKHAGGGGGGDTINPPPPPVECEGQGSFSAPDAGVSFNRIDRAILGPSSALPFGNVSLNFGNNNGDVIIDGFGVTFNGSQEKLEAGTYSISLGNISYSMIGMIVPTICSATLEVNKLGDDYHISVTGTMYFPQLPGPDDPAELKIKPFTFTYTGCVRYAPMMW